MHIEVGCASFWAGDIIVFYLTRKKASIILSYFLSIFFLCQLKSLFSLLNKISFYGGNDQYVDHLSQIISSHLCRRVNSAFMSIRHIEDLRRIKPVVLFMIKYYEMTFRELSASQFPTTSPSLSSKQKTALDVSALVAHVLTSASK